MFDVLLAAKTAGGQPVAMLRGSLRAIKLVVLGIHAHSTADGQAQVVWNMAAVWQHS